MDLKNRQEKGYNYLLPLIIGAVLQAVPVLFLRHAVPAGICAVLWPVFMILAERRTSSKAEFLTFMGVFALSQAVRFSTVFSTAPLMMLASAGLIVIFAVLEFPAFYLDRRFFSGKGRIFRTLVFPSLITFANCLFTIFGFGDTCNPGAALACFPHIVQSASVLTEHGLCFVFMWISSQLAYAIDEESPKRKLPCIAVPAFLFILAFVSGWARIESAPEADASFRVAMCTTFQTPFNAIASSHNDNEYIDLIDSQLSDAVSQGADIAVFCEEHTFFRQKDEEKMMKKISELVRNHGIPAFISLEIGTPVGQKDINGYVFFDGEGNELSRGLKNNLVPIVESADYVNGPEEISEVTLEIGGNECTVAAVVCFDISDAAFIHKMSDEADVLICPCWEWYSCNCEQQRCAVLRAVENHVTVIKPVQDGFSCIADPYGRILTSVSTEGRYGAVDVAEVPVYFNEPETAVPFEPSMTIVTSAEAVAIAMLLVLSVSIALLMDEGDMQSKLFLACLILGILGLVFDAVSYIFNGCGWSDGVCLFINLMSYLFSDFIMIAFAMYYQALLFEEKKSRTYALAIGVIGSLADIVFLTVGAVVGKLFTVSGGTYYPGPWDGLTGIFPGISILSVLIVTFSNRLFLSRRQFAAVIVYLLLPLAASLSVLDSGGEGSLSYVIVALSLLIIFVLIQAGTIQKGNLRSQLLEELSYIDILTRLKNRRAFDENMAALDPDASIGIVFCDLNGLKYANDNFGHAAGDKLIIRFAELLVKYFDKNYIYRISGDEFIAAMPGVTENGLQAKLKEFKAAVSKENDIASVGGARADDSRDLHALTRRAETLMYKAKREYHSRKDAVPPREY